MAGDAGGDAVPSGREGAPSPASRGRVGEGALRLRLLKLGIALAALALLALLLNLLFPFPWEALHRPPALVVTDRTGEPLRFFLPADHRWRFPVRLEELPPELPRALVASEDQRFRWHPGVDPLAVLRAVRLNLRAGEVVSGASTIPMQIARMAEPGPRTLASKVRESFRALQLEARYSKDELLEIYLNLTPYGGNVEGVGAAAWFYFGKSPDQLSLGEISLLTALPRSPVRYDPTLHPVQARGARDRVLRQLKERGVFPAAEIGHALAEPLPAERRRPPFAAPHLAEMATRRMTDRTRIRSALDRDLQRIAEEQVAQRIADLRATGIGNAAVVVVENETRAVRVLVGSAGFDETAWQGQVNGALARRSPGSTLKPFLYLMAFDQGRAIPDSWLLDVPTDFSGYVAENYDERYRGLVSVRDALIQSLNASAVRLLAEIGLPEFHRLLVRGGVETLDRPAGHYGLPLILGAGEVRLTDLVNLYATLAEGGVHRPLRWVESPLPDPPPRSGRGRPHPSHEAGSSSSPGLSPLSRSAGEGPGEGVRLFSPEAAGAVVRILTDVRRPDMPEAWDLTRGMPAVAWKTGTSYGHRDAWAVGASARYTIGVWVGNFDGRPRQGISGSQHAGPLLFDLFRAIDPEGAAPHPERVAPETLEVCAVSRELPGPWCPARLRVPYLPGRSRLAPCSWHRRVLVDAATGDLLAGDCLAGRRTAFRLLTLPPAELLAWWRAQGSAVEEPPPLSTACSGVPEGEAPRIVSPDPTTPYRLRRDTPPEHQRIPLVARADFGASRLFWYQDGHLVAAAAPQESRFLESIPGEHRLVVTDDRGRSDAVTYKVE